VAVPASHQQKRGRARAIPTNDRAQGTGWSSTQSRRGKHVLRTSSGPPHGCTLARLPPSTVPASFPRRSLGFILLENDCNAIVSGSSHLSRDRSPSTVLGHDMPQSVERMSAFAGPVREFSIQDRSRFVVRQ